MRAVQSDRGGTQTVLLLLMFLLAFGFWGLAQMGYASMQGNRSRHMLATAMGIAHSRTEYVKGLGYANAERAVGVEAYGAMAAQESFKRVTEIRTGADAKVVTVTVYWAQDRHSCQSQTLLVPEEVPAAPPEQPAAVDSSR
jgi:hypothetical protein